MMLATCASSLARASTRGRQPAASAAAQVARRSMGTPKLGEAQVASHAWKKSCYSGIDYTIGDENTVYEGELLYYYSIQLLVNYAFVTHLSMHFFLQAVEKLAAYNVGCLVTTDANGETSSCQQNNDTEHIFMNNRLNFRHAGLHYCQEISRV